MPVPVPLWLLISPTVKDKGLRIVYKAHRSCPHVYLLPIHAFKLLLHLLFRSPLISFFFNYVILFFFKLFILFWFARSFVVFGLSLVAVSGDYSLFSFWWILLLWSTSSGSTASEVAAQGPISCDLENIECVGSSSRGRALAALQHVESPWTRDEPVSSELAGGFPSTIPPGKSSPIISAHCPGLWVFYCCLWPKRPQIATNLAA